jgi:CDP-glucose 4,6-dehydratase
VEHWEGTVEEVVTAEFWANKSVLITGHTGFKGSWLALWLQTLGARVVGYALDPPTSPSLYSCASVSSGMTSLRGDVRDLGRLCETFATHRPEIVFHLAAQPLVRVGYCNPVDTYAINVMGTVNVLEAARRTSGLRAVVNVTSDKCYENREWCWGYREDDPMGGYDPYSSSKGSAELVVAAYRRSYFNAADYNRHGVAVASARAGNVIGGGDWADDRLVPDILQSFIAGETVRIRNPHSVRPWQHVMEPLGGYLILAEKLCSHGPNFSGPWNFGPGDEDAQPVIRIVEWLASKWGNSASWTIETGNQPHEAQYLKLDCSKARAKLGWRPLWRLSTALERILDWHLAHCRGADMRDVTLRQIQEYSAQYHSAADKEIL